MSDYHPPSLSEWALRIMALAGVCVLLTLSTKLVMNATRPAAPAVRAAQQ